MYSQIRKCVLLASLMYNCSTVSQKKHRGVLLSTVCHRKISSSCVTIVSQNYTGDNTMFSLNILFSLIHWICGEVCGVVSIFVLFGSSLLLLLLLLIFFFSSSIFFMYRCGGSVLCGSYVYLFLCVCFSHFFVCMCVSLSMVALVFSQQLWVFGSFVSLLLVFFLNYEGIPT